MCVPFRMFIRSYTGVGWTITSNVLIIFLHLGSTVRSWQNFGVANTTGFCSNAGFFLANDSFLDDSRYTEDPY